MPFDCLHSRSPTLPLAHFWFHRKVLCRAESALHAAAALYTRASCAHTHEGHWLGRAPQLAPYQRLVPGLTASNNWVAANNCGPRSLIRAPYLCRLLQSRFSWACSWEHCVPLAPLSPGSPLRAVPCHRPPQLAFLSQLRGAHCPELRLLLGVLKRGPNTTRKYSLLEDKPCEPSTTWVHEQSASRCAQDGSLRPSLEVKLLMRPG